MRTSLRLIAGPLAFALALAACGGEEPSASSQAAAAAKGPSYAREALRDNWPPLPPEAKSAAATDSMARSNYYVVLDGSGSMLESECSGDVNKIEAAVASLGEFVKLVPEDANLGLTVFDGQGISERVPLGTGNRAAFLQALADTRADGGTPLRSSITLGYDKLMEQGQRQLGYGEFHLVVVTDGVPDPYSEHPGPIVETITTLSPVVLHTIGFCIGTDHALNQPGRSYYVAADSPQQLAEGLGAVLAEAPAFDVVAFGNDN